MKRFNKKITFALVLSIIVVSAFMVIAAVAFNTQSADTPSLRIAGLNLSFKDSIYLKYAIEAQNVDSLDDAKLLVWTSPSENYAKGSENHILDSDGTAKVNGTECLIFDYKKISAKQMTDVIYARAYVEIDGEEYYSDVKKYSVLEYVYNKLGYTGTATSNAKLSSLLRGLLAYGASAQIYTDYKTDILATDQFVKITLVNATFDDGSNTALVKTGTTITAIPDYNFEGESFAYWSDINGELISNSNELIITAGASNVTYLAVFETYKGGTVDGAGAFLDKDGFASNEHEYSTDGSINTSADSLKENISSLTNGAVYTITDGKVLNISSSVNGNNAVIIAPAGVKISNTSNITISNLIIVGELSVTNSNNVSFDRVYVESFSNGININNQSSNISINNCRISASNIAIDSYANNVSILNSFIAKSNKGIKVTANDFSAYNTKIIATTDGIVISGEDNAINNCTVFAGPIYNGIKVIDNSLNTLISYNETCNTKDSIQISNATNTVVLFNACYNVNAEDSTNTYIVKNSLGGVLDLEDNNYLLCDENGYANNGKDHTPNQINNDNTNGDSLMDVNARNEVGAKEELLPHTNKDLFLGMDRKTVVKDAANGTKLDLNAYIEKNSKTNAVVIVPPGAYSTSDGDVLDLKADMSNTDIYAFGVYNEHGFLTDKEYLDSKKTNYVLNVEGAENVSIHGMTIAYDYQALGQAHVLEIRDNVEPILMTTKYGGSTNQYGYEVIIVPSPGFDLEAGWGKSNNDVFSGAYYACDPKGLSPWFSDSYYDYVCTNEDGTITLRIEKSRCEKLAVGSILCNRMAGDNQRTISVTNSENILFKDCVVHGYAAALACVVTGRSYNIKYERVHNCPTAPAVINEENYNFYKSLETKYGNGLDFEMYVDAQNRHRGSAPRFCSVDATHVISGQGLDIESCLFEQMCDDGSNQHGTSYRLHSIKDNGDGTATVFIKGNVTEVYHGIYSSSSNHERNMTPGTFLEGDNIFIYTPGGEIVCDATCLTTSKDESQLSELYYLGSITYFIHVKSVKVPIESVNFAALQGYDLTENHYRMDNKVTVDNISNVSANFTIDNYVIRNSWSRGVLTKTVNATIKHSTIQNIKSAGILANCEPNWGESTIPRNITVEKCIIDGTGYTDQAWTEPTAAPVYISGLATYGEANIHKIVANNIKIDGCHITNYGHEYGIYIKGAQNVTITNNVFDPLNSSDPGHFVDITTAVNVEISGNKYRDASGKLSTISGVKADDYANIFGEDVDGLFPHNLDIFIAGKHAAGFKIVPADQGNIDISNILSSELQNICGYSIASTVMPYHNEIRLVVNDSTSTYIKSNSYTVECTDGQLVITAETKAALVYAIEHFTAYIEGLNQSSVCFDEGYSNTFTFDLTTVSATDTSKLKYTGIWSQSGNTNVSAADADYIEFDFTGHSFTLLFSGKNTFNISIDGANAIKYTVTDEITYTLSNGKHTVRILCTDDSEPISFLGIKTYSSVITKTANKDKYVMFIGDSMVDYDRSFAHRAGDVLNWDYSVVVGNTLPSSISRTPDVFVLYLGTDAIKSTGDDTSDFISKYTTLISNIASTYKSAKVYVLLPFSTSDLDNTRKNAINTSYNNWKNGLSWIDKISASSRVKTVTCSDWGVEFDSNVSTTYPTDDGDYTATVKLAKYLLQNAGNSSYINASFPLNKMNGYPTSGETKTIVETLTESGVTFRRFNFVQNGHAWLSGNDQASVSISSAGRYLVLKYRASGEHDLVLELRTNDHGTDAGATQTIDGKRVVWISGSTKTENNVPEDWEIAIVDLAQFANYTVGLKNTKVQLRITTTSKTLDIAYAAIVDDLSEAKMAAMFELDATQYRFYEDWSKPGVDVSLNGQEIEAPFDLGFVNQEFGILGMNVYNGTKTLFVNTQEGIDYARFNFNNGQGHVFLLGANNFVGITGDTGRYLIIKYRSTNNTYISLNALTSDYPHTSTGSHMATQSKQPANINAGIWETAVIDMSTFKNGTSGQYTTDADLNVWIRFTTGVSEIDISYCAIVDDLDEANAFIKYKGDAEFVQYTNWSQSGTTVKIK